MKNEAEIARNFVQKHGVLRAKKEIIEYAINGDKPYVNALKKAIKEYQQVKNMGGM